MRIVSNKPTRGVLAGLAFLSLAAVGMAPAEPGVSMIVATWDGGGLVSDVVVSASSNNGPVKGIQQAGGQFMLHDVGTLTPDGLKVSVEIVHPTFGIETVDAYFVPDTLLRLDVVFDAAGTAESFSPDFAPNPAPNGGTPGDGGNDLCSEAIAIAVPSTTAGSTIGATFDAAPTCVTSNTAAGVWYTVTGTGTTMTATTCGNAGFDSKISVYCGGCDGLTCITGNDDNCAAGPSGLLSTVTWCGQAGATYHVLVHGFGSATGNFTLNVSANTAPCTATVECIPPEPTGACCFQDGSCAVLTAGECDAAGGYYQGDDSPCFGGGGAGTTYSSGTVNGAIPDNSPVGLSNTINVGDSGTIGDVNVTLNVSHTWTGDLIATLTHGATSVVIVDRPGVPAVSTFGCAEDNWVNLVLDDQAGSPIENACAPNLTGSFTPNNPLSAFDGADSAGNWTLTLTDNAAADTGSLVSWSVTIGGAGEPLCEPAECFLVIGDDQGSSPFVGANHPFQTQVSDIAESHVVTLSEIPSFVIPATVTQRGFQSSGGLTGQAAPMVDLSNSPDWMQDGEFAVQVVMWNPGTFPGMPEQFTAGLLVTIKPNGKITTAPYGTSLGDLQVWHEIGRNAEGQPVIRFPFSIPGF